MCAQVFINQEMHILPQYVRLSSEETPFYLWEIIYMFLFLV